MRKVAAALAACLVLTGGMAAAHGPSRQKTDQSVILDAAPDEVWAVVGDFGDMSWFPGVASTEADGDAKGAKRLRKMTDGQEVVEELTKIDPAKRIIAIRFDKDNTAVVAATNYAYTITVTDQGGKAALDWKGAFYRAFPLNDPPPDQNDDAAIAAVTAFHQKGVDALVERFGAGQ